MRYNFDGNWIYVANKYPNGLNQKWSEKSASPQCYYCGSHNTDCDHTGDGVMIACLECDNWWTGAIGQVVTQSKRGEPQISLPKHFCRGERD